jgi:hypothetical protein
MFFCGAWVQLAGMTPLRISSILMLSAGSLFAQEASYSHSSRYAFAPSGYCIPKDSAYLNVVGPLIDVQIGITDRFSAGIGTPLFLGVYGTASYGMAIAPNVHAKIGALAGLPITGSGHFALPYAVATYGTPRNNASLGLGYLSFGGNDLPTTNSGMAYNASAYVSIGPRFGFTAECWQFTSEDITALLPALRIYSRRSKAYFNVGFLNLRYPEYDPRFLGYDTNYDVLFDTQDPSSGGNPVYDYEDLVRTWSRFILPAFTFAYYL